MTLTLLVSCAKDEELPVQQGDYAAVSFSPVLDSEISRGFGEGFGDGTTVNKLIVGVFDEKLTEELFRKEYSVANGKTTEAVSLDLLREQTYNIVFWAYCTDSYYDVTDLTAVKINNETTALEFGSEKKIDVMDAFCATKTDFTVTGDATEKIVLKRPLAKVNIGTTVDAAEVSSVTASFPVYNEYHPFNAVGEKLGASASTSNLTFTYTGNFDDKFTVETKEYTLLGGFYVFADTNTKSITGSITVSRGSEVKENNIETPLTVNFQTNILGSF